MGSGTEGDVGGVAVEEARDGGDAHQQVFEEKVADDGAEDAERHVDDVVVRGVDCREPDAESDYCQRHANPCGALGAHRIDKCHQSIGRVKRGHCGENVGIAAVEAVEDA